MAKVVKPKATKPKAVKPKAVKPKVTKTKAKKPKKKKATKPKGPRVKGGRISKARKASGSKAAARMKAKGLGIFATKTLSPALASICGKSTMPRTEVTKKIWVYIKAHKLNKGRIITPDATLKKVFPVNSIDMLKLAGYVSKHLS